METAKLCCYSYATSSCFSPEKNDDVVSQEKSPMEHVTHQNVYNMAFAGKSFFVVSRYPSLCSRELSSMMLDYFPIKIACAFLQ